MVIQQVTGCDRSDDLVHVMVPAVYTNAHRRLALRRPKREGKMLTLSCALRMSTVSGPCGKPHSAPNEGMVLKDQRIDRIKSKPSPSNSSRVNPNQVNQINLSIPVPITTTSKRSTCFFLSLSLDRHVAPQSSSLQIRSLILQVIPSSAPSQQCCPGTSQAASHDVVMENLQQSLAALL